MSQSLPPQQGGHPAPPAGYPPHPGAYQTTYAGPPAYHGMPAAPSGGLNPWIAGLVGALAGVFLTIVGMTVLPMLFFGLVMGGGMVDDGGFLGPPTSRVPVAADGSVSGADLAEAVEEGGWYERVTCPQTPAVATDVTTICDVDDGFEALRVVVVFRGTDGAFAVADLYE